MADSVSDETKGKEAVGTGTGYQGNDNQIIQNFTSSENFKKDFVKRSELTSVVEERRGLKEKLKVVLEHEEAYKKSLETLTNDKTKTDEIRAEAEEKLKTMMDKEELQKKEFMDLSKRHDRQKALTGNLVNKQAEGEIEKEIIAALKGNKAVEKHIGLLTIALAKDTTFETKIKEGDDSAFDGFNFTMKLKLQRADDPKLTEVKEFSSIEEGVKAYLFQLNKAEYVQSNVGGGAGSKGSSEQNTTTPGVVNKKDINSMMKNRDELLEGKTEID